MKSNFKDQTIAKQIEDIVLLSDILKTKYRLRGENPQASTFAFDVVDDRSIADVEADIENRVNALPDTPQIRSQLQTTMLSRSWRLSSQMVHYPGESSRGLVGNGCSMKNPSNYDTDSIYGNRFD